jgi:hypothetical protein
MSQSHPWRGSPHFEFHPANIFPAIGATAVIALSDELVPPEQAALLVNANTYKALKAETRTGETGPRT